MLSKSQMKIVEALSRELPEERNQGAERDSGNAPAAGAGAVEVEVQPE